uniref:Uncharacterized protein n=1 Tax=Physcomitrium patens TaxID=3218 RepID=A0A2K1JPX8_PHYPA|nr:hypothetical protein PHYPA_015986 [Physcomitrium patens]
MKLNPSSYGALAYEANPSVRFDFGRQDFDKKQILQ